MRQRVSDPVRPDVVSLDDAGATGTPSQSPRQSHRKGLSLGHAGATVPLRAPLRPSRANILGVPLAVVDRKSWLFCIQRWIEDETPGSAVGVNAHLRNQAVDHPDLASALWSVDLVYPDGQSMVWAARALGWPLRDRLATTDMVHPLCEMLAQGGYPLFLYGSAEGVAAETAARLSERHRGLRIAGTQHGFLRPAEQPELVARINASGARVLLVGLGDPLQQQWVQEHRAELSVEAVLTCGGLFDWVSGKHRRAPGWVCRAGLEWVWRFLLEPRRLARRYLLGNPRFLLALMRDLVIRPRR